MKLFHKKQDKKEYDKENIRASICNGEQVAGFKDKATGRFTEIAYLRKPSDLESFKAEYGIEGEITKEY